MELSLNPNMVSMNILVFLNIQGAEIFVRNSLIYRWGLILAIG